MLTPADPEEGQAPAHTKIEHKKSGVLLNTPPRKMEEIQWLMPRICPIPL